MVVLRQLVVPPSLKLRLKTQVAPRAEELAQRPRPKTLAGRALTTLLAMTRATTQATTVIDAGASLLLALLTTTLRAAAVGAEALAAVHLVALAVPVVLAVGMVICHGTRSGKL